MNKRQAFSPLGFTLLEMLLVVFIMGTLATVSLTFIENEDGQWRYDESVKKMRLLNNAIVKIRDYQHQQLISGFVYDNGLLPPVAGTPIAIQPLIDQGDWSREGANMWQDYGRQTPHYKSSETVAFDLEGEQYKLFKGYRRHYISASVLDSDEKLLDGWGEEFVVSQIGDSYQLSLSDKFSNQSTAKLVGFDKPLTDTIEANDWSIQLNQLSVSITNYRQNEISEPLNVAILVYMNTADSNRWKTYHFPLDTSIEKDMTKRYGDGGDSVTWYDAAGAEVSADIRIPIGRHLMVIVEEPATVDDISVPAGIVHAYDHQLLFPRSSLPIFNLIMNDS